MSRTFDRKHRKMTLISEDRSGCEWINKKTGRFVAWPISVFAQLSLAGKQKLQRNLYFIVWNRSIWLCWMPWATQTLFWKGISRQVKLILSKITMSQTFFDWKQRKMMLIFEFGLRALMLKMKMSKIFWNADYPKVWQNYYIFVNKAVPNGMEIKNLSSLDGWKFDHLVRMWRKNKLNT